jgi:hypothetical protein
MTVPIDTQVSQVQARLQAAGNSIEARLSLRFRMPAVVHWNRLEGRPRSDDLTRPVRAEVRDALWMLARQWQFGEFAGNDAGTPVRAKLWATYGTAGTLRLREGAPQAVQADAALEAQVERSAIEPDLMMRLHMGQCWRSALRAALGADSPAEAAFIAQYALPLPAAGGRDLASLQLATHRAELALRLAVGQRSIDGAAVLHDIRQAAAAGTAASDVFAARGIPVAGDEAALDTAAAALAKRLGDSFVTQPQAGDDAWVPDRLEHSFSLQVHDGAGRDTTLRADGYPGGHLDWHAFDVLPPAPSDDNTLPLEKKASFIPTPARFAGAPASRFWEFEDIRVGFGLTTASKTDIVKLLLANFALVSSNDWFSVPLRLPVGALVDLKGIVVSDNFGFNTLVEPTALRQAGLGLAGRWDMWTLSRGDAPGQVDARLFLAPGLAQTQEAPPIEEVVFLRDEVANLVWGVETQTADPLGGARDARAAGRHLRAMISAAYPPPERASALPEDVRLRYQLMGSVPENWIPFAAVRLAGQSVASAFLQGAMPRVPALRPPVDASDLDTLAHQLVLPRGALLQRSPVEQPNIVREEELLRGGAVLQASYQQVRTANGQTLTWLGRRKLNGRGEGSSGLAFDQAKPTQP